MLANPQDPRSLTISEPVLGSSTSRGSVREEGMLNRVTLIPWEAVLSIKSTTEQERAGGGGRLSREQVAELAQRENV